MTKFPRHGVHTARPAAEWTAAECAEYVRVAARTWHSYVSRGQAPAAVRHVGRTPLWDAADVMAWQASRRGQGWRAGQ